MIDEDIVGRNARDNIGRIIRRNRLRSSKKAVLAKREEVNGDVDCVTVDEIECCCKGGVINWMIFQYFKGWYCDGVAHCKVDCNG